MPNNRSIFNYDSELNCCNYNVEFDSSQTFINKFDVLSCRVFDTNVLHQVYNVEKISEYESSGLNCMTLIYFCVLL